jgi:hypothetical protein
MQVEGPREDFAHEMMISAVLHCVHTEEEGSCGAGCARTQHTPIVNLCTSFVTCAAISDSAPAIDHHELIAAVSPFKLQTSLLLLLIDLPH